MGRVCVGCDSSKVPSDVFISAARRLNADKFKEHLVQKDMASTSKGLVYSEYSDAIVFPTRVIMTRINGGNVPFEELYSCWFCVSESFSKRNPHVTTMNYQKSVIHAP